MLSGRGGRHLDLSLFRLATSHLGLSSGVALLITAYCVLAGFVVSFALSQV